jgi:hypothetical protein
MAPEMLATDGVIDERTDVYLLAATAHRALTGKPRHQGEDIIDVFHSALLSEPHAYGPEIPAALATIANRAMARRPDDRYQSVDDFASAVAEFLRHQGSIRLAGEAAARLDELEAVLRTPTDDALAEAQKLFSESRFGFQQALREWADNEQARRGLRRAIELMARAMLARDNLETAQALAAELDEPSPELADAIAAAGDRRASQRDEVHSLRRLAHEVDANVSIGWRAMMFAGVGILGTGMGVLIAFGKGGSPRVEQGFLVFGGFVVALTVLVAAARRRVLANAVNRRIIGLIYLTFASMSGHHLLSLAAHTPVETVMSVDLLICAAILMAGAIAVDRRLALQGLCFAVGSVVALKNPEHIVAVMNITVITACTLGSLAWFVPRRRS